MDIRCPTSMTEAFGLQMRRSRRSWSMIRHEHRTRINPRSTEHKGNKAKQRLPCRADIISPRAGVRNRSASLPCINGCGHGGHHGTVDRLMFGGRRSHSLSAPFSPGIRRSVRYNSALSGSQASPPGETAQDRPSRRTPRKIAVWQ